MNENKWQEYLQDLTCNYDGVCYWGNKEKIAFSDSYIIKLYNDLKRDALAYVIYTIDIIKDSITYNIVEVIENE